MVKGVDLFQAHFEKYADYYAIIGGAAASESVMWSCLPFIG